VQEYEKRSTFRNLIFRDSPATSSGFFLGGGVGSFVLLVLPPPAAEYKGQQNGWNNELLYEKI
jgi:uncharacterized membrane protein YgaE (UPF0421/DUF939 family)